MPPTRRPKATAPSRPTFARVSPPLIQPAPQLDLEGKADLDDVQQAMLEELWQRHGPMLNDVKAKDKEQCRRDGAISKLDMRNWWLARQWYEKRKNKNKIAADDDNDDASASPPPASTSAPTMTDSDHDLARSPPSPSPSPELQPPEPTTPSSRSSSPVPLVVALKPTPSRSASAPAQLTPAPRPQLLPSPIALPSTSAPSLPHPMSQEEKEALLASLKRTVQTQSVLDAKKAQAEAEQRSHVNVVEHEKPSMGQAGRREGIGGQRFTQSDYSMLKDPVAEDGDILFFPVTSIHIGSWNQALHPVTLDNLVYYNPDTSVISIWSTCHSTDINAPKETFRISLPLSNLLSIKIIRDPVSGTGIVALLRDAYHPRPLAFDVDGSPLHDWVPAGEDFTQGSQASFCEMWALQVANAQRTYELFMDVMREEDRNEQRGLGMPGEASRLIANIWTGEWNPRVWRREQVLAKMREGATPEDVAWNAGETLAFRYSHPMGGESLVIRRLFPQGAAEDGGSQSIGPSRPPLSYARQHGALRPSASMQHHVSTSRASQHQPSPDFSRVLREISVDSVPSLTQDSRISMYDWDSDSDSDSDSDLDSEAATPPPPQVSRLPLLPSSHPLHDYLKSSPVNLSHLGIHHQGFDDEDDPKPRSRTPMEVELDEEDVRRSPLADPLPSPFPPTREYFVGTPSSSYTTEGTSELDLEAFSIYYDPTPPPTPSPMHETGFAFAF